MACYLEFGRARQRCAGRCDFGFVWCLNWCTGLGRRSDREDESLGRFELKSRECGDLRSEKGEIRAPRRLDRD
jgi:hypothetical protein